MENNLLMKTAILYSKFNLDSHIFALFWHVFTLFNFLGFFMSFTIYNRLVKGVLVFQFFNLTKIKVKKVLKQKLSK